MNTNKKNLEGKFKASRATPTGGVPGGNKKKVKWIVARKKVTIKVESRQEGPPLHAVFSV